MPDQISMRPQFILRVYTLDGLSYDFPYTSALDAKNDLDVMVTGQPGGMWVEGGKWYPAHRFESAEIFPVKIVDGNIVDEEWADADSNLEEILDESSLENVSEEEKE